MKKFLHSRWVFGLFALAVLISPVMYVYGGAGTTFNLPQAGTPITPWAFVCQTTALCSATVLIDNTGVEKGTVTNPLYETNGALDPCRTNVALIKPITIPTATTTNILTGTSAKKIYVCYLYLQTGLANNVAVISGTTGATCGANTAALVGGITAATGLINAANSGQAFGNGGYAIAQVATNNDDICIITSAAGPLAGVIKYVVQ
jgi:hypothetical protein